jgi:hypothetical protein
VVEGILQPVSCMTPALALPSPHVKISLARFRSHRLLVASSVFETVVFPSSVGPFVRFPRCAIAAFAGPFRMDAVRSHPASAINRPRRVTGQLVDSSVCASGGRSFMKGPGERDLEQKEETK